MKKIKLTQGKYVIVDDEDFEQLNQYKWCFTKMGYAMRNITMSNGKQTSWCMHWNIVGKPKKGLETDHINGNKLDNRRCNLRICTRSENRFNSWKHREGGSSALGVTTKKYKDKIYYQAQKNVNGKKVYLGLYPTKKLAHQAYLNSLTPKASIKRET